MNELVQKHLAAIEATLAILQTQLAAAREASATPKAPAPVARLEGCDGVPEAHCARVNEDARISKASFGAPHAAECKGCGSRLDL